MLMHSDFQLARKVPSFKDFYVLVLKPLGALASAMGTNGPDMSEFLLGINTISVC